MNRIGILTLGVCLLAAQIAFAENDVSIAVMEMKAKGGVTDEQMESLENLLTSQLRASCKCTVVGKADIRAALQLEEKKAMMGCSDDSCLAEIGGALGVRWLSVGSVARFGKAYLLNIRMLDVSEVKLVSSVSVRVEGEESNLLRAMAEAACQLLSQAESVMYPNGGAPDFYAEDALLVSGDEGMGLSDWGHVVFWSGVGFMAFGGVSTGMVVLARQDYRGGDLDQKDSINNWTALTFVGFGAGLALVGTGAILWALDTESSSSTDVSVSAGFAPTEGGMGFTLGGRW